MNENYALFVDFRSVYDNNVHSGEWSLKSPSDSITLHISTKEYRILSTYWVLNFDGGHKVEYLEVWI